MFTSELKSAPVYTITEEFIKCTYRGIAGRISTPV